MFIFLSHTKPLFQVTNTAGFTSTAEKSIQIVEVCAGGEVRCNRGICVESEQSEALFSPDIHVPD